MWPFKNKQQPVTIQANSVEIVDDVAIVDVRGQTCPGYLLAINKAVEQLKPGTLARLVITYPPCGEDVKAWAREKQVEYLGLHQDADHWIIEVRK
ncbi:MAG: sulfurtransferase TusA family protein [Gammaproteobacteria bacterium]|nr:sulfurtransferase TusA family protein [Gammaproteobacteria bacterium]MDH5651413.1 sulfurtransferase TusA family protein [Gammaproteobacteria bacterium]